MSIQTYWTFCTWNNCNK